MTDRRMQRSLYRQMKKDNYFFLCGSTCSRKKIIFLILSVMETDNIIMIKSDVALFFW